MLKKATNKKFILFCVLTITFVIFCGSLFSYAAETVPALATLDTDISLSYIYNGVPSSTRITKGLSSEISLPYTASGTNTYLLQYSYDEVFPVPDMSEVTLTGVQFYFFVYDITYNPREELNFILDYRYQPGRASKLTLGDLSDSYIIFYTNPGLTESYTVDFADLYINSQTLTKPNAASYNYHLDFDYTVPNNTTIYGFDVYCPLVETNQSIINVSTNTTPLIFGLQQAILSRYDLKEQIDNDIIHKQESLDRIEGEFDDLQQGLEVEMPDYGDLSSDADPFAIVDNDTFASYTLVLSPLFTSPLTLGLISLVFVFILIKYVLFGKR